MKVQPTIKSIGSAKCLRQLHDKVCDRFMTMLATQEKTGSGLILIFLGSKDVLQALGLSHRPTFRGNYFNPALEGKWIDRTQPDSLRSPT